MRPAAGSALVLAGGSLLALGRSILSADEAWFLQVLQRVATGEALYRDVFFGATPLSVYALAPLAAALGSEVWLIRAAMVIGLAATALVASRIARRVGSPGGPSPLLAAALLLLAFPVPAAPYGPLATLFLLCALASCLAWEQAADGSWRPLVLAGAACGACVALKVNIGLYASGAVLAVVLSSRFPPGARLRPGVGSVGLVVAPLAVTAALPLVPVWWSGAWPAFLDHAVLNKGTYLRLAGTGYWEGMRSSPDALARSAYLLPPLAWAGLAVAWRRGGGAERRGVLAVGAFCAAATLGIYPRADDVHLAYVMPVFLVALGFAWDRLDLGRARLGSLAHAGAAIVLLSLLAFRSAGPLVGLVDGTAGLSRLPHFRGIIMPRDALARIRADSARLRQDGGQGTFILGSQAGFYYLASGLRNPTPFDYPLVTAFGRRGEARLVAAIRGGAIPAVCVDGKILGRPLRPPLLAGLIEGELAAAGDTGFCRLYRPRP